MVWLVVPPRTRPFMPPATSFTIWLWMLSRLPWGSASTISRSKVSFTLALVVTTSGAFSTTAISSVLVWTFITMFSSVAELMPTSTSFMHDGLQLRRRGPHLELAGRQLQDAEGALVAGVAGARATDLRGRGGGDLDALQRHAAFVEHVAGDRSHLAALTEGNSRDQHERNHTNEITNLRHRVSFRRPGLRGDRGVLRGPNHIPFRPEK